MLVFMLLLMMMMMIFESVPMAVLCFQVSLKLLLVFCENVALRAGFDRIVTSLSQAIDCRNEVYMNTKQDSGLKLNERATRPGEKL
jgi:hypothetical protein